MRCEICGNPSQPTALGSLLCPTCSAKYRDFRCRTCEERVVYRVEFATRLRGLSDDICSSCHMRNRLSSLPENTREAIRSAAVSGVLAGVKEIRVRLGWSIHEAVDAVHILRPDA